MNPIDALRLRWRLRQLRRRAGPHRKDRAVVDARLRREGALPRRAGPILSQRPLTVVLASLLLFLSAGATAAYAYESPDVLQGHPLYGLKLSIEDVQALAAKASPVAQAEFSARMAQRRLREAERLEEKDDMRSAGSLEQAQAAVNASYSAFERDDGKSKGRNRALERLSEVHARLSDHLLERDDPPDAIEALPLGGEVHGLRERIRADDGPIEEQRERFRREVKTLVRTRLEPSVRDTDEEPDTMRPDDQTLRLLESALRSPEDHEDEDDDQEETDDREREEEHD